MLASGLLAGIPSLPAQQVDIPSLSQKEIASHLMSWVAPIYPSIAQAAQVQGDVVMRVEVAPDGLVRSGKIINGPPMLRQATVRGKVLAFHSC
jgi:outer membrane biosynthesis protein TonB